MQLPFSLIVIFIALSAFYYFTQVTRIRRERKRDRLEERRQQFFDALAKKRQADEHKEQDKQGEKEN
jgi:hypothetical protein